MSSSMPYNSHRSPKLRHTLKTRRPHACLKSCLIIMSACVLALGTSRCVSAQAARARTQAQAQTQQAQPIEREIAGSEIHSYGMTLAPGQFIRAVIDQRGVDIIITLLGPDGRELLHADSPSAGSWGPEPLFFEVLSGGRYLIQVRPRASSAPPGKYLFEIESRQAYGRGENAFRAERVFAEAARLLGASAGNRQQAVAKYEEALRLFRDSGDRRGTILTLTIIAAIHASVGDEQRALPFFNEALSLQTSGGDEHGAAFTRGEMARAYLSLGDRDRALEYFEAARRGFLNVGDRRMAAYTFVNAGAVHDSMGERREALADYERALPLF